MKKNSIIFSAIVSLALIGEGKTPTQNEMPEPAETVRQFHQALQQCDGKTALRLLAKDVVIYESGGAELSRQEYAGHHMPLDMEFSKNMKRVVTAQTVQKAGDTAIVFSESSTRGTFKDKEYNLLGKETIVLKRMEKHWKITHIHWSSMSVSE